MTGDRPVFYHAAKQFAYVAIPKAACSSVREAFGGLVGVWPLGCPPTTRQRSLAADPLGHMLRLYRIPLSDAAALQDTRRWSIVRHPEVRLESCWADKLRPEESDPFYAPIKGMGFAEFVCHACSQPTAAMDVHYAPQAELLEYHGTPLVDEVWQLEDIATRWPLLRQRWGLPLLPIVNMARRDKPSAEWTPLLRALVRDRYAADYTLGGYQ